MQRQGDAISINLRSVLTTPVYTRTGTNRQWSP